MEPTFHNKDIILIKKYNLKINYNDVVVIKKDNKIIIKRIVGLPKDEILIDNYVYINNKKYDDLYTPSKDINYICLNNNKYFVLGDNREESIDSRSKEIGIINKEEIVGRKVFK